MTESVSKNRKSKSVQPQSELPDEPLHVLSLDMEAQGVAHRSDGKVVFIDGALPFEVVSAKIHRSKSSFDKGVVTEIHQESAQRVTPGCAHFGLHEGACGGCKMQHLHMGAQVAIKQRVLEDVLWHIGKVRAENMLRPIEGPSWAYRYRARLSVKFVRKKGEVLIGFHERKSHFVADIKQCPVLAEHVAAMLLDLRKLVASMDAAQSIPQIELAVGEPSEAFGNAVTAMVLRHMEPLSAADMQRLREFAAANAGLQWWLQPKGLDSVHRMEESFGHETGQLAYVLPDFGITMPYKPIDFTQVNPYINRVLVSRAIGLLDVKRNERVIDWFCGLGNFTLPLATRAASVCGIEGSEALVERSRENLRLNLELARKGHSGLASVDFKARNLFEMTADTLISDGAAEKWLVDPPREGAYALVQALAEARKTGAGSDWKAPSRIVYVSCNPSTLARDAGVLETEAGYKCKAAGVVNMFAHTAHVESIAVFERIDA